jgi:uncharacterized lipoprotein YmbA
MIAPRCSPLPLSLILVALCASGCLMGRNTVTPRQFVLSPIAKPPSTEAFAKPPGIGVGIVRVPGYLQRSSMVVRKDTNELVYLDAAIWAERLDSLIQRSLAENLSTLVPTDSIRLSSWLKDEVHRAVFVTVERLDVDQDGTGTLIAWWRVTSSEGSKTYKDGEIRITQKASAPGIHPEGVAETISKLLEQMSVILAEAIRSTANEG